MDEPVVVYDGVNGATRTWLYADPQGSVTAAADAAGSPVSTMSYGPFGEPNTTTGVSLRYTGQFLDADSGLYYYKARWYSPYLGRFLSPDPALLVDGLQTYTYVGNDPVNYADPTGTQKQQSERCSGNKSIFSSIADGADTVGNYADGVAIGAAGLGLITAPTGAGGAFFGTTALVAGGVGRLASGVSVLANLADKNYGGAASSALGIVGGHVAGKVVGGVAAKAYARNRVFNDLSAGQERRVNFLSDTGTAAGSRMASRAICN